MREKRKTLDKNFKDLKLKKIAKKQKLQERGITLIALVVTIVILLILSGVTLNIALSDNGLFDKTKKATEEYKAATVDEEKQIAMLEAAMNLNGTEYKSTYKGEDVTVPIPAGFAVSSVDGENTVEDGLVIIDSEGNEFVWIPVTREEEYVKKIGAYNCVNGEWKKNSLDIEKIQIGDYLGVSSILGKNIGLEVSTQPEKDIVVNAGGFYVGRYEAGVEVNDVIDWGENPKIVVKKNVQPARNIGFPEAMRIANQWIVKDDVQSGLITGTEWDVMCEFVDWAIADEYERKWGNFMDVKSDVFTGFSSNGNTNNWIQRSDWIKKDDKKNIDVSCAVFPCGVFRTEDGRDTARRNIYDIAGNL